MNWNEVREYGISSTSIDFESTIEIDISGVKLETMHWRQHAIQALNRQLGHFCSHISEELYYVRNRVLERVTKESRTDTILPWIGTERHRDDPIKLSLNIGEISSFLDTRYTLPGQLYSSARHGITIKQALIDIRADDYFDLHSIEICITSCELTEGSLIAKVKGFISSPNAILLVVVAAIANPITEQFVSEKVNQWEYGNRIKTTIEGQPCESKAHFIFASEEYQSLLKSELNYLEQGINAETRALRICNLQVILAMTINSPDRIDGIVGEKTEEALNAYKEILGLDGSYTIDSPVLRGLLIKDLINRASSPGGQHR